MFRCGAALAARSNPASVTPQSLRSRCLRFLRDDEELGSKLFRWRQPESMIKKKRLNVVGPVSQKCPFPCILSSAVYNSRLSCSKSSLLVFFSVIMLKVRESRRAAASDGFRRTTLGFLARIKKLAWSLQHNTGVFLGAQARQRLLYTFQEGNTEHATEVKWSPFLFLWGLNLELCTFSLLLSPSFPARERLYLFLLPSPKRSTGQFRTRRMK